MTNNFFDTTPDFDYRINQADVNLKRTINRVLAEGTFDENPRAMYESDGTPAFTKFISHQFETYDIGAGELPLPSLMPTAIKSGFGEILWIYKDQTSDLSVLQDKYGINWWNPWDIGDGTIGQRYGATVGRYALLHKVLTGLEEDPFGRRHVINLLQESDLRETTGLYPCAYEVTLTANRLSSGELSIDMLLNQRSSDYITAGFINKAQYTILLMMIVGHLRSRGVNAVAGKFSHMVANLHIYDRHIEEAKRILTLSPKREVPSFHLARDTSFFDYTMDDLIITDHNPHKRGQKLELGV